MNRREFSRNVLLTAGALGALPIRLLAQTATTPATPKGAAIPEQTVEGVVFHDRNKSGRAAGNPTLAKVRVSNSRDVVETDIKGRYKLNVREGDIVFVVKPRGYALRHDERNMPQFFHIHSPSGSPKQDFAGLAPTGALPASLDFGLQDQEEKDEFRVLLFGDPQSRNQDEVDYFTQDILNELVGVQAAFGVSLGDEAFDDLSVYTNQNRAIATLGLPWVNVMGNHDINYDAPDRRHSAETYKATFGPTYYSFDYGSTHFVVLDNVAYDGKPLVEKKGTYHTELGAQQVQWLTNDLKFVPREQLVVFLMHIPLVALEGDGSATMRDLPEFFRLVESRPNTLSISAHTHFQEHRFIGRDAGWQGAQPHHHFNHATVCGSWWRGAKDERGIPHTTMRDGAPNGYSFLNIKGNQYTIDFQAAGKNPNHQMNVYAPAQIKAGEKAEVLANVFAGSTKSRVEMQIGDSAWQPMTLTERMDPAYVACKTMEDAVPKLPGRKLPEPINCSHLWVAETPATLPTGVHLVTVRTVDQWGRTYMGRQMLRVA